MDEFWFFKDDIVSADLESRGLAIDKVPDAISSLGLERTICELIPRIATSPVFSDSELSLILEKICEVKLKLPNAEYLNQFFDAISPFFEIESTNVRDGLVNLLYIVCKEMDKNEMQDFITEKICELLHEDWPFGQIIGILLDRKMHTLIDKENQTKIFDSFFTISDTHIPLLLRYVVAACGDFMEMLDLGNEEDSCVCEKLFEIVNKNAGIQSPTIPSTIPRFIMEYLKKENSDFQKVLPIINQLAESANWRIRCKLFMSLPDIKSAGGDKVPNDFLTKLFLDGLKNSDNEVILALAKNLSILPNDPSNQDNISNIINTLLNNPSPHVKTAIIQAIAENEDQEFLKTNLSILLEDPSSEVRSSAMNALQISHLSNDDISTILLNFLNKSRFWRDHLEAANVFISKNLNNLTLLKDLLFDDSSKVRKTVLSCISRFDSYEKHEILNIADEMSNNEDYQIKQDAIMLILVNKLYTEKQGLDILDKLSGDNVSNVRLVIARYSPRDLNILEKLKEDPDEDVKLFANEEKEEVFHF